MKLLIHSQTSTVQFHSTLYWVCGYVSMLGLNLNYISKMEPWRASYGILFGIRIWHIICFVISIGVCDTRSCWTVLSKYNESWLYIAYFVDISFVSYDKSTKCIFVSNSYYRKTSNISRTLVGDKIVDHSDAVGASPVGAAPTTSSFST